MNIINKERQTSATQPLVREEFQRAQDAREFSIRCTCIRGGSFLSTTIQTSGLYPRRAFETQSNKI